MNLFPEIKLKKIEIKNKFPLISSPLQCVKVSYWSQRDTRTRQMWKVEGVRVRTDRHLEHVRVAVWVGLGGRDGSLFVGF